jgi:hypothetical protein
VSRNFGWVGNRKCRGRGEVGGEVGVALDLEVVICLFIFLGCFKKYIN